MATIHIRAVGWFVSVSHYLPSLKRLEILSDFLVQNTLYLIADAVVLVATSHLSLVTLMLYNSRRAWLSTDVSICLMTDQ